tara:strand:+ start:917 stop:1504 length:588 start_codon:yes stop_codon:yes gene_type:complete
MSLLPYASLIHRRRAYRAGDVALLSTQTATNDTDLSFTSRITSTYGEYIFKFYNINAATDNVQLTFNVSTDGGSNYNLAKTSSAFRASHDEADSSTALGYLTAQDLAEGTGYQMLGDGWGNGADESGAGELHIFNPSSTTFVKHYYATAAFYHASNYSFVNYVAGYINTTSDVDAVQFKMSSGNFDGVVKMWGVK